MPQSKIHAGERSIGDIFTDEYRFTIPRYQRPYAWTEEQAGEMFEDLRASALSDPSSDEVDPYFLGSIVLVKRDGEARAEVVDGQQRLTTLTILLAVLRQKVSPLYADSIDKRIFQRGDPIKRTVDQPRLSLRDRDQPFFETSIQRRSGIEKLGTLPTDSLPDSQRNLIRNAELFTERLSDLDQRDCEALVTFIDQQTYLVMVATQDFDSAYRIFTVLNERGLDLTHADILKSEIIGEIASAFQDTYLRKWEEEEEDLGRADFADLFAHIRMIYAKSKQRGTILREFRSSVLAVTSDPKEFIDEVLVPLSDAYEVATRADFKASSEADAINRLLEWLNRLDNIDWIPPAMLYIKRYRDYPSKLKDFLTDLERLAASIFIRRVDLTRRIERYGRLIAAIEAGQDLSAENSPLQLDLKEQEETLNRLDADIYSTTRTRTYILLRLDSALSSGGASYDHPMITVEHVLPQSPAQNSLWRATFTEDDREFWVNRLANLVLLTRRKNSEASNLEFDKKKERYFTTTTGTSPFVLTTQVLREPEWSPKVLQRRQEELTSKLSTLWRL